MADPHLLVHREGAVLVLTMLLVVLHTLRRGPGNAVP